jgi:hypothetical protein
MYYENVGLDLGTTYSKDSQGNIYPSGISEIIYPNCNTIVVDGKKYSMEQKTGIDININKGLNKNTRINFLYSLAKISNYEDTCFNNVFVSLPAIAWKNESTVESFKKYLFPYDDYETTVNYNGIDINIQIDNINILPEGFSAYYSSDMDYKKFDGRKVLIIDYGGLTVNEILFENDDFVDCHTDEMGILKTYQKMAQSITTEFGKNINYLDMFDILKNGLFLNGEKINIDTIIEPIALQACEELKRSLELRWNVSYIPYIQCIGASSIIMIKYLKHYIPQSELTPNPQTIAVKGMIDMMEVI